VSFSTLSLHDALPIFFLRVVPVAELERIFVDELHAVGRIENERETRHREQPHWFVAVVEMLILDVHRNGEERSLLPLDTLRPPRSEEHTSELQSLRHL